MAPSAPGVSDSTFLGVPLVDQCPGIGVTEGLYLGVHLADRKLDPLYLSWSGKPPHMPALHSCEMSAGGWRVGIPPLPLFAPRPAGVSCLPSRPSVRPGRPRHPARTLSGSPVRFGIFSFPRNGSRMFGGWLATCGPEHAGLHGWALAG